MSENFVRKTLNVEDITKKETYTLNDLDLIQTKNGHVYIRINKKGAQSSSSDKNAYLYELTNITRTINGIPLYEAEKTSNNGQMRLPLIMNIQHLEGEIQVSMVGDTSTVYKVNDLTGKFSNETTLYTIPLTGIDELPDITIKRGTKVIDVYKLHQADWNQKNKLHPEYIKGSNEFIDVVEALNNKLTALTERVTALEGQ